MERGAGSEVCPLEWRYGSPEMRGLLSREGLLRRMLEVEAALARGLAAAGIIPEEAAAEVERAAARVRLERVEELEAKLGHDIMALAVALAEESGGAGRYVHLGATSYDIVDTAWALVLRDALGIVKRKLAEVLKVLAEYCRRYRRLIMVGRTHGQHALPITLGFKLANYAYELARSLERLRDAERRVVRGKMSGAVGTMAAWGDKGLEVERETLRRLGLEPHAISTQVAPRDGFAELLSALAILASQLDRLAIEVRELMRPEIDELAEGTGERVGSSTMPQKRNPVTAERVSGLAKVVRSLVLVGLENIPLWHERDLTNSSSERIAVPHALLVVDEMLGSTLKLLRGLVVKPESMRRNLELTRGAVMAEAVMVELVRRGLARHEAHAILREVERRASEEGVGFREALLKDPRVARYLSPREVEELLRPERYLGACDDLIDRALRYVEEVLGTEKAGPHRGREKATG